MKLIVPCGYCSPLTMYYVETELTSEPFIEFKCGYGHPNTYFLQQFRHEYLFESGLLALVDGHAREAVSSIAAALERYYEFWLSVVAKAHGASTSEYETTWKLVAKQSERQLGGFILSHLLHYARAPKLIEPRWVEFRNGVIHRGDMPTSADSLKYAESVANHIVALNQELHRTVREAVEQVWQEHAITSAKRMGKSCGSFGMTTVLGVLATAELPLSLDATFVALKSRRQMIPTANVIASVNT